MKLISSGGGVNVAFGVVAFGPKTSRSVTTLTQPNPVVAAKGFPGPDLILVRLFIMVDARMAHP